VAVPGARKVVFPGTAHMVNMEQPERFNATVLGFLASV
jgi:pimeloyl-ACP methyl ester carboxylesterase